MTRLVVIRHAIAEDRDAFAATSKPDSQRPLTDEGRKRMRRAVKGLRRVQSELDLVATSPLVRAAQTAEIIAGEFKGLPTVVLEELSPERRPDELLGWLRAQPVGSRVAVVGHEPHLGFLVGWLLTGRNDSFVELKKGSACALDFTDPPTGGNAVLAWSLSPRHLRWLAEGT